MLSQDQCCDDGRFVDSLGGVSPTDPLDDYLRFRLSADAKRKFEEACAKAKPSPVDMSEVLRELAAAYVRRVNEKGPFPNHPFEIRADNDEGD